MKRILIVDDNTENQYMLEILLKTHDLEVDTASNGIEALEKACQNPPDMIVSDILMPGMDGFGLCRAWKTDEALRNIPFVFYTATYTDPKDEEFALSLGAERFIVKPMDPDEFMKIMQEIILASETKAQTVSLGMIEKEEEYYREYNQTLIRKLEDKMVEIQRDNKRLLSFYRLTSNLAKVKNLPDLIHSVLCTLVETAGYEQASHFNYDEKQHKLFLMDAVGISEEELTANKHKYVFSIDEEQSLVGAVARTRKIINIPDTTKESRWIVHDPSMNSALYIPVLYEDNLRGIIVLCSREKEAFTEDDEHVIATLTNALAIALENEKNQQRIEKQLQRLSALHGIDLAIKGNMDLRATLNILLDYVTKQLQIDAANILLYNSRSLTFDFAAGRGFITRAIENQNLWQGNSVAEKVIITRCTLHMTNLIEPLVPAAFAAMCASEKFLNYWGVPLVAKGEVKGVLEVFHRSPFTPETEWLDYLETLAGQAAIAIDNAQLFDNLQRSNVELRLAYDATIEGWSRALYLRDKATEEHVQRLVEMTVELAKRMGYSDTDLVHIRRGALLHDIGKMGVPDYILLKPGPLTEEEWAIMRMHPQYAFDMLSSISYLQKAMDIPYCHHEKWDGSGYPRGLKGERIPLAARLFAVVDVWDALRSDRPYRKAWQDDKAIEYIREQSGKHFDPKVVEAFLSMVNKTRFD